VGLKGGLLYTNLLTPFLLIWIHKKGFIKKLVIPLLIIMPFSVIHYIMGVDLKTFIISHVLFFSSMVFVLAAYIYLANYKSLKPVMKSILVFNFVLVLIAIPFYFMDKPFQQLFWYTNKFTDQSKISRLSLFTFEASYYSLLLVPIVYYYLLKIGFYKSIQKKIQILALTLIPLILSMSFGILGGTLIVFLLMIWFNRYLLVTNRKVFFILSSLLAITVLSLITLFLFFSDNILVARIGNIFTGTDTSYSGRTSESFQVAWEIASKKSIWFGSGLGQPKLLLPDIIEQHIRNNTLWHWKTGDTYRIPNTLAETLAIFGIIGLVVRLVIIFYLFVKTKVNTNYFRLSLFLFIFIYQFTGSYITNVVEYVIWVFAFTNVFPEFDVNGSTSKQKTLT
jgi:hypothetical protein